jgi:hypothetical protein
MDTALSENGRVVAGSRQGNGMVFVNRPLKRQGNGMGTAWEQHGMCESAFICRPDRAVTLIVALYLKQHIAVDY